MATPAHTIDLFSDTATKPSSGMRRAMAEAEVGDEQRREDPTVNRLQQTVAEMLGKEAALYLPSGAMCNQIAYAVHARAGDEILLDATAHPIHFEAGGATALIGAVMTPLAGERGIFTAEQVAAAVRPAWRYSPRTRVVSIEQTTNLGGGAVWPLGRIEEIASVARAHGLAMHCDGARLMNAVVATRTPPDRYGAAFDSIWIDFSKGLGAPVGAVLAGSRDFIEAAWVWKQRLGGAMRQAGIIAAGALYALENNVERLRDDHANAALLGDRVARLPGLRLEPVETNIVIFDVAGLGRTAAEVTAQLEREHGVRLTSMGRTLVRAVTHLDVSRADVERAATALESVLGASAA
jgi:threonine aldolase